MKALEDFSKFLLTNCLDDLTSVFAGRLKEAQFATFPEFHDDEYLKKLRTNFKDLLEHISNGTAFEYFETNISLWQEDKHPEVKRNQPGLHDLIHGLGLRKITFVEFIPRYTNDVQTASQIMIDLIGLYNFYREKAYQAYLEIQNADLQKEKDFIEAILESTDEGISGLDRDLKVTVWNHALERRTGVNKKEILGRKLFDIFPHYATEEREVFLQAQKGESIHLRDRKLKHREGFFDLDVIPLTTEAGEITGSLSFSRDVTDKRRAIDLLEEANRELKLKQEELNKINTELEAKVQQLEKARNELRENNRFIESIIETTEDFVTVYSLKEKKNVFANKRAAEYLGFGRRETKNGNEIFEKTIHPEDAGRIEQFLQDFFSNGEKLHVVEYRVMSKGGSYRWLRGRYNTLTRDLNGVPVEIVGISQDITEEKAQQQQIEEALNYYLKILDDFPALIWRADEYSVHNYFNKKWLDFTGRTLQQEIKDGWIENIHPDDYPQSNDIYLSAFKDRVPSERQYRLRSSQGAYRWVLEFGQPLFGLKNEFTGYLGACFDIQERKDSESEINAKNADLASALEELKSAEEQLIEINLSLEKRIEERTVELAANEEELTQTLEKSIELNEKLLMRENFLAGIIDQTPVSTVVLDARGTVIQLNHAFLHLFGIEDPSMVIDKYNIFKDELFKDQPFYPQIFDVFEKGILVHFNLSYDLSKVTHIGFNVSKVFYLSITVFPIKDHNGKVMNAVIKHEDFTEKVKAEEALKASETQLRMITESLPVLISYVDRDLKHRFVNKAYTRWFNKGKDEIIGRTARELFGMKNYNHLSKFINKALSGEEVKCEAPLFVNENEKKDVLMYYIPDKENGRTKGFYAMISDISPLKHAQMQLMKKNQELLKTNSELDSFVYTASHDLKSPIVNLEGITRAIERTLAYKLTERERTLFSMMEESIIKLNNTISSLSEAAGAAKVQNQKLQPVSIPKIVEEVKYDIRNLIEQSKATFIEDYKEPEILFMKAHIKSILYNLISNSVKYRDPSRAVVVKISSFVEQDCFILCVQDNGLGLTKTQQAKLFTMFKRIHKHVEGSGIGLYIVKRIVENAGGKIEVESHPNEGSMFKIFIPF